MKKLILMVAVMAMTMMVSCTPKKASVSETVNDSIKVDSVTTDSALVDSGAIKTVLP